ncbi:MULTISPECIES: hypothetical protein [Methanobacterium]|uniref:Uncharacterized protein n=1 Tax=Methanobacterium bryantii TaxID=2161 RepID=A0A2A2H419_METBR|nr:MULTISPECIES: hypothetical protein [Methanobacterium]OEC86752.1 hypothetical protein A9507_09900 [Methanobacterium sp. A39]PAV04030.1 hypothetical protein ASJ80_03175 [Methanobacterium bryantii]
MALIREDKEKSLMYHDLDLIEDYLAERFQVDNNELKCNSDALECRYKFNYDGGIDVLKEFADFYRILFSKLSLISIKSFMNNYNKIWVEIGYKSEVLSQIEKIGL